MAFGVQAIAGGGTVSLSDGNPFYLHNATGMGGAPVRRVTSRGPAQDGDTDLGYRLNPREIQLEIGFHATTDAALDGYRDTLMSIFKPLSSTPINLRVTRDDGVIRQLDVYATGGIDIKLLPEHRPGHYHRATVRLYAPDVAYYNPTPGTVTITGTGVGTATDWYLAGGAIDTAQVMMQGGTPTQGQAWSYTGTITTSYTLAFRSLKESMPSDGVKYAFFVDNPPAASPNYYYDITFGAHMYNSYLFGNPNDVTDFEYLGNAFMVAGTGNYFLRYDISGGLANGSRGVFRQGTAQSVDLGLGNTGIAPIQGTARLWRSDASNTASTYWSSPILLYALYSPGLNDSQVTILDAFMSGAIGGTVARNLNVTYVGDLPEYPIISVRGPITGMVMTNVATHHMIHLGTTTIADGETYVFDLRPGYKTVTSGTVNKRGVLGIGSDWDAFHLTSDTAGGLNSIFIYGTNTSSSTQISVVYYNRYSSF